MAWMRSGFDSPWVHHRGFSSLSFFYFAQGLGLEEQKIKLLDKFINFISENGADLFLENKNAT